MLCLLSEDLTHSGITAKHGLHTDTERMWIDMDRLTDRNQLGLAYLKNVKPNEQDVESPYPNTLQCILESFNQLATYEDTKLTPAEIEQLKAELAQYKQAEADGLLVRLPESGIGDLSDGYHTFNELYHHRAVLFSVICNEHHDIAWKSKLHHDGTMYDGNFIVGVDTTHGQATYHYDIEPYWNMFRVKELDKAPEWDGHTPDKAIERIASLTPEDAEKALKERER